MNNLQAVFLSAIFASGTALAAEQGGRAGAQTPTSRNQQQSLTERRYSQQDRSFAVSVVRSATAIEGMNPQDRLRVLAAAASVVSPIRPGMAKSFSREGLRIEQDLIQRGESPAVSMINSGAIDCRGVVSLVENIPAQRINAAEQSIIGGVTRCSQSLPAAQRLVATGLDQRSVAPRAVLAVMERTGLRSAWSQEQFEKLFASLPSNAEESAREAPNFAAMYARVAPEMTKDDASQAGLELLAWLTRLNASATRNLAVNITTDAMKSALGDAAYAHALATDVAAQQIAQTAGQKGEVEHHPEESASVLQALSRRGTDRFTELKAMAPSQRAREAAASGFAEGTDGDRNLAQQYFAVAFSALDELWKDRDAHPDAHLVIQEVSEAAAQVNPVAALKRTQQLSDPAAQAIGMVAVARVVANRPETSSASARERQSR